MQIKYKIPGVRKLIYYDLIYTLKIHTLSLCVLFCTERLKINLKLVLEHQLLIDIPEVTLVLEHQLLIDIPVRSSVID